MGKEILMPQNAEIDSFIKDTPLDNWKQIRIKLQSQNPEEKKVVSKYNCTNVNDGMSVHENGKLLGKQTHLVVYKYFQHIIVPKKSRFCLWQTFGAIRKSLFTL